MGCDSSAPVPDSKQDSDPKAATLQNTILEQSLHEEKLQHDETKRLLFLGTGASGKSTFMKQIIQKYGDGFGPEEKLWWKHKAAVNVLESLQTLCDAAITLKEESKDFKTDDDEEQRFHSDLKPVQRMLQSVSTDDKGHVFNKDEAVVIDRLWKNALVQFAYDNRGDFVFDYGDISYFFDRLDKLADEKYVFELNDIAYVRSKTNGIYETAVAINGIEMVFIDVAGQRSSRKKWISCFGDVTAVIWVSALDNYNEVLPENANANAMDDAMEAFEWAVNHPMLQNPSFTLFLNKIDLLEKKVTTKPEKFGLQNFFDDYTGDPTDAAKSAVFLKNIFLSCVPEHREIPAYTVQGTDAANATKVLHSVIFGLLESKMNDMFG